MSKSVCQISLAMEIHLPSFSIHELHKYGMMSILTGWQLLQATNKDRMAEMVLANILHGFLPPNVGEA